MCKDTVMEAWNHNDAVKKVAAEHGLDPKVVSAILNRFFSSSGLQAFLRALRRVNIAGFFAFIRTDRTMKIRQSPKYKERQRKRKYYYKKIRGQRSKVKEIKI